MSYDNTNVFARILRKELPCEQVYEDDYVLAFHDINPQVPTHIVVIPKGAYVSFQDFSTNASSEEICAFVRAVAVISSMFGVVDKGYRIVANHGFYAGQEVPHFHMHILGGRPLGPMIAKQS